MVQGSEITPFDFEVVEARISADRLAFTVDLARVVAEINIFEHIDKPFLTGNILFNDNDNLYNEINWQGTEYLDLTLRTSKNADFTISRKFRITKVVQSVKSNDQNETFLIDFTDNSAYESAKTRVQKHYQGKHKDVIERILDEHLGLEMMSENKPDSYKDVRAIIPNMTPLQAAMWIKDRSPDVYGSPYFLYASLADERIRYIDLETILSLNPVNAGRDYIYAQAFGSKSAASSFEDQCFIIQTYRQSQSENMIGLVKEGYVGAKWNFFDTTRMDQYTVDHDISKTFDSMVARGVFPADQNKPVYDKAAMLHETSSREINQIATSRLYSDWETVSSIYEAEEQTFHAEKVTQKSLRNFLMKSSIDINVPGHNFLLKRKCMTLGNNINVMFQVNDDIENDVKDHKRSGRYMVYAARHVFTANRYTVNLTCAKLSTGRRTEQL
jgi:hypothetical protein